MSKSGETGLGASDNIYDDLDVECSPIWNELRQSKSRCKAL